MEILEEHRHGPEKIDTNIGSVRLFDRMTGGLGIEFGKLSEGSQNVILDHIKELRAKGIDRNTLVEEARSLVGEYSELEKKNMKLKQGKDEGRFRPELRIEKQKLYGDDAATKKLITAIEEEIEPKLDVPAKKRGDTWNSVKLGHGKRGRDTAVRKNMRGGKKISELPVHPMFSMDIDAAETHRRIAGGGSESRT